MTTQSGDDVKMTFDRVKRAIKSEFEALTGMKKISPKPEDEKSTVARFDEINASVEKAFGLLRSGAL